MTTPTILPADGAGGAAWEVSPERSDDGRHVYVALHSREHGIGARLSTRLTA